MKSEKRIYTQSKRAMATAALRQTILQSLVDLWRETDLDAITLQTVADRAGTTVQSVLRHFGSRDGLVDAVIADRASGIEATRDPRQVRDLAGALDDLLRHYEDEGDAVLRTLAIARSSGVAARVIAHGQGVHRNWCLGVLSRLTAVPPDRLDPVAVDAFVAATDISVWKLLRRDLARSPGATLAAMRLLAEGVIDRVSRTEE